MTGIFETVTRAAIAEIVNEHTKKSKFGYVLSEDGFEALTEDVYSLLMTSRRLKDAGDKLMGTSEAPRRTPTVTPKLIR